MKKFILFSFIFLFFLIFLFNNLYFSPIFAEEEIYYARIINKNTFLLSSPLLLNDNSNQVCSLPETYFVKVLDKDDTYYKVQYMDLIGYIKGEDIKFVKNEPLVPFANNLSFRVFTESGVRMRSHPNTLNGVIYTTLPFMEDNIIYYGFREGEESIIYKGKIWYYCKYISNENTYVGYVYSPYCDLLTDIEANTESMEYIEPPSFIKEEPVTARETEIDKLDDTTKVLLISLSSLPCILIIYLLFKPTKIATESASTNQTSSIGGGVKRHKKKKIKRLKRQDYFEID